MHIACAGSDNTDTTGPFHTSNAMWGARGGGARGPLDTSQMATMVTIRNRISEHEDPTTHIVSVWHAQA